MTPPTLDLTGHVAVVTGGAGQLGRTICRTLARCGASVGIHYRTSRELAEKLASEIRDQQGAAEAIPGDVTRFEDVLALRDWVQESLGIADIVVPNAVIQYDWKSVLEQEIEDYEGQFRSCVMQSVHLAKAFVPGMIERGRGGRIVAVNTECAVRNWPSESAYVAGKRGMDGVLRVLAKEVGPHGVTVNQVAPGWTESDRIRGMEGDPQAEYIKSVPLRRAGTDQDIANAVAFLASDLAGFITGAFLPVSGGTVMPAI